jgi:hypothetical protein
MADGQNATPRPRSPLSPSAVGFSPTFHRKGVSKLFVSAKTAGAIPILSPAIGDALVLASLDAKVRSIGFIASARRGKEHVDLDVVVVQRGDRLFFMDVVTARRIRDLEDEGLALIALEEFELSPWTISAEALRREPRYSNTQFVWQYNRHRVPAALHKHILHVLDQQPMQLGRLLKRIGGDGTSPAILSLACADVLEIDLASHPIDRTTMVRLRRYPPVR